jgi:hypothetical protein
VANDDKDETYPLAHSTEETHSTELVVDAVAVVAERVAARDKARVNRGASRAPAKTPPSERDRPAIAPVALANQGTFVGNWRERSADSQFLGIS